MLKQINISELNLKEVQLVREKLENPPTQNNKVDKIKQPPQFSKELEQIDDKLIRKKTLRALKEDNDKLLKIEREIDEVGLPGEPEKLPDLSEYSDKKTYQIRNIERANKPESLEKLASVFWEIKENKLVPINPSSVEAGKTVLTFYVPEANGKNKGVEMGISMRTLACHLDANGKKFEVFQIDGRKAYRLSNDVFLYEDGEYAGVRSHLKQKIIPINTDSEDEMIMKTLKEKYNDDYLRRDLSFVIANRYPQEETVTPKIFIDTLKDLIKNDEIPENLRELAQEQLDKFENFSGASFIEAAEKLKGTSYVWGGQSERGTDCSGLILQATEMSGVHLPDKSAAGIYECYCDPCPNKEALISGDLLFWDKGEGITHVAIYLGKDSNGDLNILDASSDTGCVTERSIKNGNHLKGGYFNFKG